MPPTVEWLNSPWSVSAIGTSLSRTKKQTRDKHNSSDESQSNYAE